MNLPFFKKKEQSIRTGGQIYKPARIDPDHAAMLRTINAHALRMYAAAISNNLNFDDPISISSANAEIFTSALPLHSRARTLERDNPYAWSMLEAIRTNVVGHEPFRLEMKVGKKTAEGEFIEETDTNEMIQEAWTEAGLPENATTRRDMSRLELDLQNLTAIVRDEGAMGRQWTDFPKNKYRYAVQPLEIDRLDHYWNSKNEATGNQIKMSVELDSWDGVEAYWLLARHPGEVFYTANLLAGEKGYRERIPADQMLVIFDIRTRSEQVRGVSRFASVIARLHRIEQFDIAHVTAAIWASCKPFFITQEFPTANEYIPDFIKQQIQSAIESDTPGEGEGDKTSNVEPGTGEILGYGQKPVLVDPKFPIEAASAFKKDHLRAASAGTGVPYNIVGQDLEGVNFSSGRLGYEAFHDSCKILQEHYVLGYRLPQFKAWLKNAILFGGLDLPITRYEEFCRAACFHGRRWGYINPLQDAQCDILRIEAGLTSRDEVIQNSERGGDVEKVNAEIASGRKSDEAHGLDFTSAEPTTPTLKKGEVGQELPNPDAGEGASPPPKKGGKQTIKSRSRRKASEFGNRFLHESRNGH